MFRRILSSLFALVLVSGCSSTNKAYYDTLKLAFTQSDNTVSSETLRQSKADLMAVKHGDRVQIIMALAYIEGETQTWVSADHALLSMQKGVITETHGLANDLIYHSDLLANPLFDPTGAALSWHYLVDIENYGYGLDVQTVWQRGEASQLTVMEHEFSVYLIEQAVNFNGASPFYETGTQWVNRYWFDDKSGEMLKSEQLLSPAGELITMTYLSRAQRLIDGQEVKP